MRKSRTFFESVCYAISGIVYSLRTQRNMRIHFMMTIIVMISSFLFRLDSSERAMVSFAITFVIVTEMINTSIETTIDLFTEDYHHLAKIGKNVAAGAVLIAALNAVVVGYVVFFEKVVKLFIL